MFNFMHTELSIWYKRTAYQVQRQCLYLIQRTSVYWYKRTRLLVQRNVLDQNIKIYMFSQP